LKNNGKYGESRSAEKHAGSVMVDRFGLVQQVLPVRQNPVRTESSQHPHFFACVH
jgi:hypothetical protein